MARVRGTIELLAKVLRENGTSKIKAETFRQAKFNQDEAVPAFWRLLFELVYFCQYMQIDEVAVRAYGELTQEELVTFVKHELQERGFHSYDFALLPSNYGHGSRELLLAVGWLMCKEHILDRFIMKCTEPLDEEEEAVTLQGYKEIKFSSHQPSLQPDSSGDPHERIEQLLWLNRKMRLQLRKLLAIQLQKNALTHQIHEHTSGVSLNPAERDHLTPLEVLMLQHPKLMEKNLELLERDSERLQNLLDWRDHEDTFWKWMESVLDAKLSEEKGEIRSLSSIPAPATPSVPGSLTDTLMTSHLNLREAIVKYESIIDHLERLWGSKSVDVTEDELESVLASIDLELSMQRANIAVNNTAQYVNNHQKSSVGLRWNYKPNNAPRPGPAGESGGKWRNVETELTSLRGLVSNLEVEVNNKRANYKSQLQQLSHKFTDTICIPPMQAVRV